MKIKELNDLINAKKIEQSGIALELRRSKKQNAADESHRRLERTTEALSNQSP